MITPTKHLTITQRIIAGFVMVVSLMGLVTWSGLELLDHSRQTVHRVVTVDAHNLQQISSMVRDLTALQRAEKNVILARNQEEMTHYDRVITTLDAALRQRLLTLLAQASTEDRLKLEQFHSIFEKYSQVQQEIIQLTRKNSNVEARNLSQGTGQETFVQLALGLESLVDQSELRVRHTSRILAHSAMAKSHIASQLLDDLLETQKNERILLFEDGGNNPDPLITLITASRKRVLETAAKLESLASPSEEELLARFRDRWLEYGKTNDKIMRFMQEGSQAKGRETYKKSGRAQHEIALKIFRQLIQQTDKDLLNARREMEGAIEKAHLGNRINRDLAKIHRAEKDLILTQDIRRMDEYAARIVLLESNVLEQWQRLTQHAEPDEIAKLATLKGQFERFAQITMQVVEKAREDANHRAFELSVGKGRELVDQAEHILRDLVDHKDKAMQMALRQAEKTYQTSKLAGLGMAFTAILLCVLIAHRIIRTLSLRVQGLVDHAHAIALGQMVLDDNPNLHDELTIVGKALNAISERYLAIATMASRVVAGDCSNRLQLASPQDQMSKAINEIIENMETIISQAHAIAQGRFDIDITPHAPNDRLRHALKTMAFNLQAADEDNRLRRWQQDGLLALSDAMRGRLTVEDLSNQIVKTLCNHLDALSGVLYLVVSSDTGEGLQCTGTYAAPEGIDKNQVLGLHDGLLGTAAQQSRATLWQELSSHQWRMTTGMGTIQPSALLLSPFHADDRLRGVVALAFLHIPDARTVQFFEKIMDTIAMALETAQARPLADALNASRTMAAELQQTNARLRQQSMDLKTAQTILQQQNHSLLDAQETLKKQAEQLQRSDRYKSEFLATMSHELRTPMNGMLGMAQLLEKTALSPEQKECVTTILNSGAKLLLLIDDILDLSKIEAGMVTLRHTSFALAPLFGSVHDLLAPKAHEKSLQLTMEIDPHLPPCLMGDAGRLHQVILNLAGNAIKFTEQGKVTISVQNQKQGLRIEIRDTGIGIPETIQGKLFHPFVQGGQEISRRYGGTGLGLAISKSLVKAMGGQIGLESTPGQGTLFWINLPLEPGMEPANTSTENNLPPRIPHPLRVLLVEDEPVNQQVALGMLEQWGAQATLAENGEMALKTIATQPFDLVLMDIRLPDLDGLEITKKIRALQDTGKATIPIIALTSHVMKSEVERCYQAGMDGFLAKPILFDKLGKLLHDLANPKRMTVEDDDNHSLGTNTPDDMLLDASKLEKMAVDLSVTRFANVLSSCLTAVEQSVMHLQEALTEKNPDHIAAHAHRLQGGSGALGLRQLNTLAKNLEQQGRDRSGKWSEQGSVLQNLWQDSKEALHHLLQTKGWQDLK